MEPILNVIGAVIALLCSILLYRNYLRTSARLLLWSAICFFGLTLENLVLFADMNLVPHMNLQLIRHSIGAVAISCLVIGLVLEER